MGLDRLAGAVILSWGWSRRLIALAAGASGALALAPLDLWPFVVVPMTIAVWLIDGAVGETRGARFRSAFSAGWWWGFGYFLAGLWWLGSAFLVEADKFAWAMPLGVIALPAFLALFPAFGFGLARLLWPDGAQRILILAVALTLTEFLRGHILTGFPWNVYGMMLAGQGWLAQSASVVGLYGLTLLAVAIGAAPAVLGDARPMRRVVAPVLAIAAVVAMAGFGWWRIPEAAAPNVPGVKLRLMQPNLPQDAKFNPANAEPILAHYLALSDRATGPQTRGVEDVTHLIWPESAFPFLLGRSPQALSRIGALLPPQATLITGAARAGETLPGESRPPIYNSIQIVDTSGVIVGSYDKVHLVPFGEYLPPFLNRLIRSLGLSEFVAIPGGFSAGTSRAAFSVPGLPAAAALICYEVIFPSAVTPAGPRPGFMLNVTNDGWFGRTSGPYQHLAQARLRSIEEGLPLVRAANTGISAVVDGHGRTVASLPLGQEGVLDSPLPQIAPITPFARYGHAGVAGLIAIFLLAAVIRRRN